MQQIDNLYMVFSQYYMVQISHLDYTKPFHFYFSTNANNFLKLNNISFHSQNIRHHNLPFLISKHTKNIFLKQLHNKIVPKYKIMKFNIPINKYREKCKS